MGNSIFDIPEYDREVVHFMEKVFNGFFSLHPIFGNMNQSTTRHHGPIRNISGENPLDQRMEEIARVGTLPAESINNSDFYAFATFLFDLAQSNIVGFSKMFYRGLSEITNITGLTFNAGGQPFSFDQYLDMLERMEIDFKSDGKPVLPTMITHPELALRILDTRLTQEQENRLSGIIVQKKETYDAQKRTRRLS